MMLKRMLTSPSLSSVTIVPWKSPDVLGNAVGFPVFEKKSFTKYFWYVCFHFFKRQSHTKCAALPLGKILCLSDPVVAKGFPPS